MFNIDSSIFMSKLTEFSIHAVPDNRKMKDNVCSFCFPKLLEFERNYAAAYQYATTGNIDYLR